MIQTKLHKIHSILCRRKWRQKDKKLFVQLHHKNQKQSDIARSLLPKVIIIIIKCLWMWQACLVITCQRESLITFRGRCTWILANCPLLPSVQLLLSLHSLSSLLKQLTECGAVRHKLAFSICWFINSNSKVRLNWNWKVKGNNQC